MLISCNSPNEMRGKHQHTHMRTHTHSLSVHQVQMASFFIYILVNALVCTFIFLQKIPEVFVK